MIVYNVQRRWFSEKIDAEKYRKEQGLKPSATVKITVEYRGQLASLLNALCEPTGMPAGSVPIDVVDRAYVAPRIGDFLDYVPRFLLDDAGKKLWDERNLKKS